MKNMVTLATRMLSENANWIWLFLIVWTGNASSGMSAVDFEFPEYPEHFEFEQILIRSDTFPFFRKPPTSLPTVYEPSTSHVLPSSVKIPLEYRCKIFFEGRDPVTGERKKELSFEPLLSYTPKHIKPYMPGVDLLEAQSKFIRYSGGYTFLGIRFIWNAQDPIQHYGRLKSNGAIRFSLTDQNNVTLFNREEYTWIHDAEEGRYEINALYMLHPRQIKLLQQHALMKVTIYWEKGFEEYPVYPITLFLDQLSCLE